MSSGTEDAIAGPLVSTTGSLLIVLLAARPMAAGRGQMTACPCGGGLPTGGKPIA